MKTITTLINSNIYISLAAVLFAIQTQIQLGKEPHWHPYLFLLFFATLLEYNLHRLITILTNKAALNSEKHSWVRRNLKLFYLLVIFSLLGFLIAALQAKREVLWYLAPVAVITLFYSIPFMGRNRNLIRLREIPYLKIFLISCVWSYSTIILPVIEGNINFKQNHILLLLLERFFFVFAITLPFDVRDMDADQQAGLKTLPLVFSPRQVLRIAHLALVLFLLFAVIRIYATSSYFLIWPLFISAITTGVFINSEQIKKHPYYHYGILDGTMLLQSLLVGAFYALYIH